MFFGLKCGNKQTKKQTKSKINMRPCGHSSNTITRCPNMNKNSSAGAPGSPPVSSGICRLLVGREVQFPTWRLVKTNMNSVGERSVRRSDPSFPALFHTCARSHASWSHLAFFHLSEKRSNSQTDVKLLKITQFRLLQQWIKLLGRCKWDQQAVWFHRRWFRRGGRRAQTPSNPSPSPSPSPVLSIT